MEQAWMLAAALAAVLSNQGPAHGQARWFAFSESYLGVHVRDVTRADAEKLNLPRETGVHVERVTEESPAAAAGLQTGDVILELAGLPVISVSQFQRLISDIPPGREVDLVLIRDGQRLSRTVTIGRWESGPERRFPGPQVRIPPFERLKEFRFRVDPEERFLVLPGRVQLGISGVPITEQLAGTLSVPGKQGVLVMEVVSGSPAERAGLRAGDVITSVNGNSVKDIRDLRSHLKPGSLTLEIVREGGKQQITVQLESREHRQRESLRL